MCELISHLRPFGRSSVELGGGFGGGWSSWEEVEGGGRRLEEENVEGRRVQGSTHIPHNFLGSI